jgi:hypothetical protein
MDVWVEFKNASRWQAALFRDFPCEEDDEEEEEEDNSNSKKIWIAFIWTIILKYNNSFGLMNKKNN